MSRNSGADLFREIEHTGDVGIEIEAGSRAELFRRAALAIAQLMVDTTTVLRSERRELSVPAADDADLMHDLLSVLLQTFVVDCFIWSEVMIDDSGPGLKVYLLGERFDPDRHEFRHEIKAVTYHELSVRSAGGRWLARIIFDV
jgi:SHS2 domain-containing protein